MKTKTQSKQFLVTLLFIFVFAFAAALCFITAPQSDVAHAVVTTYTVSYNAGAYGSGSIGSSTKTAYEDLTLSSSTFTRAGYNQTGWSTSDGGEKAYDLGGRYSLNQNITLYPVWTIVEYSITYNYAVVGLDDVTSNGNPASYTIELGAITLAAPTKTGFTFEGWYDNQGFLGDAKTSIEAGTTGNIALYAKWTASTNTSYTVKHYQQNITDDNYTEITADEQSLSGTTNANSTATAKNYTGFTAKSITQQSINGDGTTVVSVYYDRVIYTITWKNGTETINTEDVKYGVTPSYDGTAPTKASDAQCSYVFKGWTPEIAAASDNTTYVAEFTNKPFTITNNTQPDGGDKVASEIIDNDGFAPDTTFVVKVVAQETVETALALPNGKVYSKTYNATLYVNDQTVQPSGEVTIKFAKPAGLPAADTYTIIIVENGATVEKAATLEGEYLVFTTSALGDFAIITDAPSDETASLLWLVILLAILNALEIIAIAILLKLIDDNKKRGVKTYSFAGLTVLIAAVATGELAAIITLGITTVIMGAILGVLVKKFLASKETSAASETPVEENQESSGDIAEA